MLTELPIPGCLSRKNRLTTYTWRPWFAKSERLTKKINGPQSSAAFEWTCKEFFGFGYDFGVRMRRVCVKEKQKFVKNCQRKVDVCCIKEVRWRGLGAQFISVDKRKYKLWWSGNDFGKNCVGVLVTEKLWKLEKWSGRVMLIILMFGEEMWEWYVPHSETTMAEKQRFFYDELAREWNLRNTMLKWF